MHVSGKSDRPLRWLALVLAAVAVLISRGSPAQENDEQQLLKQLLDAHNEVRAEAKLPPLVANPKLQAAARVHAIDMAKHTTMSHTGSDESTPAVRIQRQKYNYRACGENVARGQENVRQVMKTWLESPPHKKNILGDFTEMGGAFALSDDGQLFWCVDFGRPWPELSQETASNELISALNQARAAEKKRALKRHAVLERVAIKHAKEIAAADELNHDSENGSGPAKQLEKAGYRFRKLAQELFSGEYDSKVIVETWLNEAIHRDNVLGDFSDVGVGYATTAKGTPYWCIILTKPR